MLRSLNRPDILVVTLAAAGILMVTMGARQSLGLFIAPIGASTGLGIATIRSIKYRLSRNGLSSAKKKSSWSNGNTGHPRG